jgi:hypothetical protein
MQANVSEACSSRDVFLSHMSQQASHNASSCIKSAFVGGTGVPGL